MTNREWLNRMCLADILNTIICNNDICVLNLFDKDYYCKKKPPKDRCYNCACNWLNKKHEKFFIYPLTNQKQCDIISTYSMKVIFLPSQMYDSVITN